MDELSRRWFLAGGVAVVLGAGAGVGAELLRETGPPASPLPPEPLLAAARTERALLADLDATTGGSAAVRVAIVQARADHAAHLDAILGLLARYRQPAQRPAPRPAEVAGTPRTRAELAAAERVAAAHTAGLARALTGGQAALLASIAACEATHAELLT